MTYRRRDALSNYVGHLRPQQCHFDTLTVVDNDRNRSAESVVHAHGLKHTRVTYLANDDNVGPAGGIALGMAHVLETADDDDWLFTLDDDDPPRELDMVAESERFAEELVAEGHSVGGVGLVGGRFDERLGRFVTVDDAELTGAVDSSCIGGNQRPCYPVRAVRSVGGFDSIWFINFEELDYGLRMRDHGYRLYAHGELWRRERIRAGRLGRVVAPLRVLGEPQWRRYYSARNLVFLLRQRGHAGRAARVAALHLGKPLANLVRPPTLAWGHLRLNTRAVWDAYRGNMGRTVDPLPKSHVSN